MITPIDLHFLGNEETVAVFLIEYEGGLALVESGPHSTFPILCEKIRQKGHSPADIKHIFLTHIHLDHAGAAWAFAQMGAKVYVHPFGYDHLANPAKLMESARRIYKDQMDRLWGDMQPIDKDNLIAVAHEQEIGIGNKVLKAWHTAGHAHHHIAWQLDDVLFTGDVAGVQIGKGPVVPPCPPPDIDIEKWQSSLALIRKLPVSKLFLTHYGEKTNIHAHLDQLESALLRYSEWMRNRLSLGETLEQITPHFEAFAAAELRVLGLGETELAQYQAANPAWMSVAGLARYWQKKTKTN
jgi:glyoxylase-like metal-dependent hydrolase (beta-lactamase superfamily II)